jgi:hypothetical protein
LPQHPFLEKTKEDISKRVSNTPLFPPKENTPNDKDSILTIRVADPNSFHPDPDPTF